MMRRILSVILACTAVLLPGQTTSDGYQSALILEVKDHQEQAQNKTGDPSLKRYDVTIQVKDTVYVMLCAPGPGTTGFQGMAGLTFLVLVKTRTITYNDILGRSRTCPIVSQRPARARTQPLHQASSALLF